MVAVLFSAIFNVSDAVLLTDATAQREDCACCRVVSEDVSAEFVREERGVTIERTEDGFVVDVIQFDVAEQVERCIG
jgi:hypothetical protein